MAKSNKKSVKIGKNLIATKANDIKKKLLKASEQEIHKLILDFAKVETMDTIGLSIVLAAHNMMKNRDGDLELVNVAEQFSGLFETMRLNQHFDIHMA